MTVSQPSLEINSDLARTILTGFIRSEIGRHGFSRGLIGLSGGVDSAVSCYLAAEALGPKNVLALRLPYRTSDPISLEHAEMVIRLTGVEARTIDISPAVDGLLAELGEVDSLRAGNIMARMRMIALYDQSAQARGLVIGTSNKTEILLGYTTLYGDSASALNPLGDLYKTQVRQLAAALGVPGEIIDKPPSADLWAGQTDEDELGVTYDRVDRLFSLMIDGRYSVEDCVEAGFDRSFVLDVLERVRRSQFKRLMPPIAKLGDRTVGYDFLYLRDWGT
jgi:NAD+ synthase